MYGCTHLCPSLDFKGLYYYYYFYYCSVIYFDKTLKKICTSHHEVLFTFCTR